MSTATKPRRPAGRALEGEWRWLIPDATWDDYQRLTRHLPPPLRVAFDGRRIEIMVTSSLHDVYADALDAFFKAVAGALGIAFYAVRSASLDRDEVERGLQADNSYYLDPAKIATAAAAEARRSRKLEDYPTPDLAVEVDLSPPKADRKGVYAALGVPEVWIFDGAALTMHRLGEDRRYEAVARSRFLPVRAEEVPRWILHENRAADYEGWTQRMRAWARRTLKRRR